MAKACLMGVTGVEPGANALTTQILEVQCMTISADRLPVSLPIKRGRNRTASASLPTFTRITL